jgi:hypothetical protein
MGKWEMGCYPGSTILRREATTLKRFRFRGIPGESPMGTRKPSTCATRQRGQDEDKRREEKTKKRKKMRDKKREERRREERKTRDW